MKKIKNRTGSSDLSREERLDIYRMRERGEGIREIARKLHRSPSTISVELSRNKVIFRFYAFPWYEQARLAHAKAKQRRGRPRNRGCGLKNAFIREYVYRWLEEKFSPKDISLKIQKDFPGESISHESIYQYIYKKNRTLLKYLVRYGKTKRNNRWSLRKSRQDIAKTMISERPTVANTREEVGHLESDFIVSARGGKSCLMVIVERQTRHLYLRKTPNREADTARKTMFSVLNPLPSRLRRSLTVDNDSAHNHLPRLETVFKTEGFKLYWCNPYCAWERGTVEAINGILRRWFPKGTNFDLVSEERIKEVQDLFNQRPMKVLGGKSPDTLWQEELSLAA